MEMLEILAAPFVACVVLAGIHCYLGLHVVMREVIFVDLALAQIAALGAAVGMVWHLAPDSPAAYLCTLGFTLMGAALFAFGRFRDGRVPQEAIIGIVYAVATAASILIFSQFALERDEIDAMLVGRLLFVSWPEIGRITVIYAVVAALHFAVRRPLFLITRSPEEARRMGLNVRLWDFFFYATFGLVVSSAVRIAGVLLVFSFLIVPAVCSMMFFTSIRNRLLAGWGIGLLASVMGLTASGLRDYPTGAAVVTSLGALLMVSTGVYAVIPRRPWVDST